MNATLMPKHDYRYSCVRLPDFVDAHYCQGSISAWVDSFGVTLKRWWRLSTKDFQWPMMRKIELLSKCYYLQTIRLSPTNLKARSKDTRSKHTIHLLVTSDIRLHCNRLPQSEDIYISKVFFFFFSFFYFAVENVIHIWRQCEGGVDVSRNLPIY